MYRVSDFGRVESLAVENWRTGPARVPEERDELIARERSWNTKTNFQIFVGTSEPIIDSIRCVAE